MTETQRLYNLFADLYDGSPWLDVSLFPTLKKVSAERAGRKIAPNRNSIWEIVEHLIGWREAVLQRLQGHTVPSPPHNYFYPVQEFSENAWQNTLERLRNSQQKWLDFLKSYDSEQFDALYPGGKTRNYEHIHGILQHDAYHLGQIVLLTKLV